MKENDMLKRRCSPLLGAFLYALLTVNAAMAENPVRILYDHRNDSWCINDAENSVAKLSYDATGVPVFKLPPKVKVEIGVVNTNPMLYRVSRGELTVAELESRGQLKALIALLGTTIPMIAADGAIDFANGDSTSGWPLHGDPSMNRLFDDDQNEDAMAKLIARLAKHDLDIESSTTGLEKLSSDLHMRVNCTAETLKALSVEHQQLKDAAHELMDWVQNRELCASRALRDPDILEWPPAVQRSAPRGGEVASDSCDVRPSAHMSPEDHDRIVESIALLAKLTKAEIKDATYRTVRKQLDQVWGVESMILEDAATRKYLEAVIDACPKAPGEDRSFWRGLFGSSLLKLDRLGGVRTKQLEALPKAVKLRDGMPSGWALLAATKLRWEDYSTACGTLLLKGPSLFVESGKKIDGSIALILEDAFKEHVYPILGEKKSVPFRIQADDSQGIQISVAMVSTGHRQKGWGGVTGPDDDEGNPVTLLAEKTDERLAGDLALFASIPVCSLVGAKRSPGAQLSFAVGTYLDEDSPGILLGAEVGVFKWLRVGTGWSYRRMTILQPGQRPVRYDVDGLQIPGSGTPIGGDDEIRTQTDFQGKQYVSISVRIDGIPLFSKGD